MGEHQSQETSPGERPRHAPLVADDLEPFQHLERSQAYPYSWRDYVRRVLWLVVQGTLVRFSLPRAYGWRRFWLRRFGATVDATACTRPRTWIIHPWLLTMDPRAHARARGSFIRGF